MIQLFRPRIAWAVARREFSSFFVSPIAYIVIAAFLLIMGWMFFYTLVHFMQYSMQAQLYGGGQKVSLIEAVVQPIYSSMNLIFIFVLPFVTMRVFAEEKKQHTVQLWMTAPVRMGEMVLGKFFAVFCLLLLLLLLSGVYPAIVLLGGNAEWGPVLTSVLGCLLLGSCYLAMGLCFSSMTENQIVAGALTFAGCLFFWIISWASSTSGSIASEVLNYLSLIQHWKSFGDGILRFSDVLYYVSFIGFFLWMTRQVLDSYRWR